MTEVSGGDALAWFSDISVGEDDGSSSTTWSTENPNGQFISVTFDKKGQLIKRVYADNGDIHMADVVKFLAGWQKAVEQRQHGGRHKGTRLKTVKDERKLILKYRYSSRWKLRTDKDFLTAYPQWKHKLARAKREDAKGRL